MLWAMTWVSKLPPVMTYTMSNALSAVMTIVVATTAIVGSSSGKTIRRKTCHSFAPSTRAASSSSTLMPLSAAEMMTMQKPVHIQAMTTIRQIVLRLRSWTWSQGDGSMPNSTEEGVERAGLGLARRRGTGT